ncbi:hypothetical protein C8R42DRAFT_644698 [Lentinula raphanica]|nr:hypothetical protein C8R42DRAFT_644698 [Lentinula raphanica]
MTTHRVLGPIPAEEGLPILHRSPLTHKNPLIATRVLISDLFSPYESQERTAKELYGAVSGSWYMSRSSWRLIPLENQWHPILGTNGTLLPARSEQEGEGEGGILTHHTEGNGKGHEEVISPVLQYILPLQGSVFRNQASRYDKDGYISGHFGEWTMYKFLICAGGG